MIQIDTFFCYIRKKILLFCLGVSMRKFALFMKILILALTFFVLYDNGIAGAKVTLISPTNGYDCVIGSNAVFVWNKPPSSAGYTLHVSSRSNCTDTLWIFSSNDSTQTLTNFGEGITLYWRVQTTYADMTAPWSNIWSFTTRYFPPTLSSPMDNSNCLTLNVPLRWAGMTGWSYRLQISTSNTFATTVFDSSGINVLTYTPANLNYATRYYWRMNMTSTTGCTTNWTLPRSFQTTRMPPTNNTPSDKATDVSLRAVLRWTAAGSPTSHHVQVASDSLFANVVYDNFSSRTYDTAQIAIGNATFYWRIKSSYSDCESEWSKFFSFTTLDAHTSTVSPTKDTTCLPLFQTLEWQPVTKITTYRLQISESNTFSPLIVNRANIQTNMDTVTLPKSLQQYFWRVRAEDVLNTGQWSDTSNFTTAVGYPVRLTPYNKQDSLPKDLVFTWKKIGTNIKYHLQISDTNNFSNLLVDSIIGLETFSFRMPEFFKTYYWRMSAKDIYCQGIWSPTWQFRVVMPPPNPLTPADNSTNLPLNIKFTWDKPETSERYGIQVSKSMNFSPTVVSQSGLTVDNLTITNELEPNTTYYWRVNATSSRGTSFWSKALTFLTGDLGPAAPALVSPLNGAFNQPVKVTLNWQTTAKAKYYLVQAADNPQFVKPVADEGKVTGTTHELNLLKRGMTYYWHVAASNDTSRSAWSKTWSFTVAKLAPTEAPNLLSPANNILDAPLKLTFDWDTVARAEGYDFQLTDKSDFDTDPLIYDSLLVSNSKWVSDLKPSTIFSWRTRAKNSGGYSPWSDVWKFKTTFSSVETENESGVLKLSVAPNPIRNSFTINYSLPNPGTVKITIVDQLGIEVGVIEESYKEAGSQCYQLSLTNNKLSSGTYFITIKAGDVTESRKVGLIR